MNSPVHFNRNLFCAVDIETTGLSFKEHEIIQFAVIPLGSDYALSKHFRFFEVRVMPERMESIDPNIKGQMRKQIVEARNSGMERWSAVEYFKKYFYNVLKLPPGKKIVPLGANYQFDMQFLVEFFGGPACYEEFFRSDYRDVQLMALHWNDVAEFHGDPIPFPKVNLGYLCNLLGIDNQAAHTAVHDAISTAEVFRRLLKFNYWYRPVIPPTTQEHPLGMDISHRLVE